MKSLIIFSFVFIVNIEFLESYRICDRSRSPTNSIYRLPKTVTPIKYRIKLRPDLNRYKYYGSELIQVLINNRTDIIELNSVDLNIENVWFQTRRIRVEVKTVFTCVEKETIILQFYKPLDRGYGNLSITFNGKVDGMITGFYRDIHTKAINDEGGMIAVTDFGPTDSRRAFPNWDEPYFKAMIELTLITPRNHKILSNMREIRRRDYNSEMEEIRFETSPPMTSNVLAMVVGKFDYIEKLTEDEEVLVRVFTPIGRQEEGMFALEVTSKLLMYYKYFFNTSFPLLKLDLISISDFPSSMENWGLITFTETQILVNNKTTEEEKRTIAVVIAHALAHQWFGNLVTIESWNDMWITEGFATSIENEAIDILYPNWKIWQNFVSKEYQNAMELDSIKNTVLIEPRIDFPSEIEKKFTDLSYQKSAALIRMFSHWIGKEKYRNGIRLFLSEYSYKTTTAYNLWKTFEGMKDNLNLKELTDSWVLQKGHPVIDVKERQSGANRILTLTQERFLTIDNSSDKSEQLWQIPIKIINQFSPFTSCAEVLMVTNQTEVVVKDVLDWEWVKLNHNSIGFLRVNYPIEMLNKFKHSIEDRSMPAMDRLNILSDLFAVIQSGRISTHIGLKYLLHYKNDDNSAVWSYILGLIRKLDLLFSDTDLRENFWSFGIEMLSSLRDKFGWDPIKDEDLRVSKLRPQILELLATFKDKKVITEGLKRYEDIKNDNSNATEQIILVIYKIVGANCDQETFEDFFEQYRNAGNAVKRNRLITALISTSEKERILKVLDFSLSENIRFIDSAKIISGLCHSMLGRDKTWKFFEKNFLEFTRMFGSTTIQMSVLIKNFIEKFSSEDKANEFENFFGEKYNSRIDKIIETSLEKIRINAKWLNRDIIQIREYFSKNTFNTTVF